MTQNGIRQFYAACSRLEREIVESIVYKGWSKEKIELEIKSKVPEKVPQWVISLIDACISESAERLSRQIAKVALECKKEK